MLWLLPAIALAGDVLPDADLVLLGSVTTVEAGAPRDLWRFAKAKSFRVVLPPDRPPHVCVSVRDVLLGDHFGEAACFWRVGLAAAERVAVGADAVWFLDRAAPLDVWYMDDPETTQPAEQAAELKLLLAQRSRQPGGKALPQPSISDGPTLREAPPKAKENRTNEAKSEAPSGSSRCHGSLSRSSPSYSRAKPADRTNSRPTTTAQRFEPSSRIARRSPNR